MLGWVTAGVKKGGGDGVVDHSDMAWGSALNLGGWSRDYPSESTRFNGRANMKSRYLLIYPLVAVSLLALAPASAGPVLGSTNDGGVTITVTDNGDGTHTVSTDDGNGHTTSTVQPKLPPGTSVDDGKGGFKPWRPRPKEPTGGSKTEDGVTTTVTHNGDGTKTVATDDGNGHKTSAVRPKLPPGISVDDGKGGFMPLPPRPKSPVLGSTNDGGVTITVTDNGDGTKTVTTDDGNGHKTSAVRPKLPPGISVDDGKGGFMPLAPKPKSPVLGSTMFGGLTTTVVGNADGTRTVLTTDINGRACATVPVKLPPGISVDNGRGGFQLLPPRPQSATIGSSTYGGVTTTVTGSGRVR